MRALRIIAGIIAGIVLANLLIYGSDWLLAHFGIVDISGLDGIDEEYIMQTSSRSAQLCMIAGWMLAAGAGSLLAFVVARSDWTGWVVAGWVGLLTGFGSMGMYPHPTWLVLLALVLPFVGAVFAFGLYRRWRAARLHLR